jgi:hypothetical protein
MQTDPQYFELNSTSFNFAMGFSDIDMTSGPRYFDYYLTSTDSINGSKTKTSNIFKPCNRSDWEKYQNS